MRLVPNRVVMLLAAVAANAAAASISGTYTLGCTAASGNAQCFPGVFATGSIDPANPTYTSPHYSVSVDPPIYNEHYDAGAYASFDLRHDNLHAYLSSSASILNPVSGVAVDWISRGYAALDASVTDALSFSSSTLAPGSNVAFTITGVLHSVIQTNHILCNANGPNAWAAMTINGVGSGRWYHSTCGDGSDVMESTLTFHSTVGGHFGIATTFQLVADSIIQKPAGGSYVTTVDAQNTARLYVNVLTPGVSFTSDSGAAYSAAAVPEPSAALLVLPALGALWARRRMWPKK